MQNNDLNRKQEEIEHYYDEYVKRQAHVGTNRRHYSIIEKLKLAGLKPTDQVLEIGCGIGTLSGLLIKLLPKGTLLSMDISNASISYAKDTYQHHHNLNFIHADASDYDFGSQMYQAIVLPDVLEHIPLALHSRLFAKLSQVLHPDGFMFIHIPNPYYLKWCHDNRPDLLQIIDQPITTDLLVANTYPHGFYIEKLVSYAIWVQAHDYQYIIMRKNGWQDFSKSIQEPPSLFEKLKYKWNEWRR